MPLVLSAFTHLWNPVGFPFGPANDEGIDMLRAMHVLEGLGPQLTSLYDHPYFSQLFLGAVLGIIGYPHLLNPSPGDVHSVETLWLVPRILMGLLAIADTFLVYKISECYYKSRNVAIIAAVIFAVMPISWMIRRIWLEPIQLPFFLASILFATYSGNLKDENRKRAVLILLAGIFLGIAIFTKIPAITMIPLVAFLIHGKKHKRDLKYIGLWLTPVILIPLVWPLYALYIGQFNLWWDGIILQTQRGINTLFSSFLYDWHIDPVFIILGIAGLGFAAIRRDFFILLWFIPFLIFLYIIGFVSFWHFIPVLPASCIGAAAMIEYLSKKISNNKKINQGVLILVTVSAIISFGLVITGIMIASSDNSSFLKASAAANLYLQTNVNRDRELVVMSNPFYLWIPAYVFHFNGYYYGFYNPDLPPKASRILLIIDPSFIYILKHHQMGAKQIENNFSLYTRNRIAAVEGNQPVSIYVSSLRR